jgi:phage baseplate assembly protein W
MEQRRGERRMAPNFTSNLPHNLQEQIQITLLVMVSE